MAKTALFIIDIQDTLALDPKTRIPHASRLCSAATSVIDRARAHISNARSKGEDFDLQIVFVQHEDLPDDEDPTLVRGTKGWELAFKPIEHDAQECLVGKTDGNTFQSNPELALQLKSAGVKKIVACGLQSEYCVRATSKGALENGFEVTVLSGAHSTYDSDGKSAAEIEKEINEELKAAGASIIPWPEWNP